MPFHPSGRVPVAFSSAWTPVVHERSSSSEFFGAREALLGTGVVLTCRDKRARIEAVAYDEAGTNIGWGNATAQNVVAGGTARAELTVVLEGDWDTVEITQVQRTAST